MGIVRIKAKPDQRLGNDSIYGSGYDGSTVISSTFIMNRDYYWDNLTINSTGNLFTNGYRVFVQNTLTMAQNATMGMSASSNITDVNTFGTLIGRADDAETGITKQYVLGDSSSGTQVPPSIIHDLNFSIRGWHYDPVVGFRRVEGGDDGGQGVNVAGTAGGGSNAGAGGAGSSGGSGGSGGYAPAPANPGNPGNPGTTGASGNPGNPGNPGNAGAQGIGGQGGDGGGLVVVVAKNIVYSGESGTAVIESWGRPGYYGSKGNDGTVGTTGTAGTGGAAGTVGAAGNAGSGYPAQSYPSTQNPIVHTVSGHNPSTRNHHTASSHTAATAIHANAHGGRTIINHDCKADTNPAAHHHRRSNQHSNFHNDGYKGSMHQFLLRSNAHHGVHNPATNTGNHHCNTNYNPNHNHTYVSGHNPATTNHHHVAGSHNPQTQNHAASGGTHNAAVHYPAIPGGAEGIGGTAGAGGAAGAAGVGGAKGIGGTGGTGTVGLRGGLLVVCDTISASINTVNGGHGTVLLNA